jgi:hypothetical protein
MASVNHRPLSGTVSSERPGEGEWYKASISPTLSEEHMLVGLGVSYLIFGWRGFRSTRDAIVGLVLSLVLALAFSLVLSTLVGTLVAIPVLLGGGLFLGALGGVIGYLIGWYLWGLRRRRRLSPTGT